MATAQDSTLTPKDNPEVEKIRRELQRKSLDQIKCLNPYDEDREVIWAGFRHVIPAKGERILYRYLAVKYFRETTDWRINKDEQEAFEKQNEKRAKRGNPPMTPQEREQFDMQYGLSTGNEKKRKEIMTELYGGISEEYGLDMPTGIAPKRKDERSFEERLLEEMEGATPIQSEPNVIKEKPNSEIEESKRKLIEETKDERKSS
jgi:hypothetical protein